MCSYLATTHFNAYADKFCIDANTSNLFKTPRILQLEQDVSPL